MHINASIREDLASLRSSYLYLSIPDYLRGCAFSVECRMALWPLAKDLVPNANKVVAKLLNGIGGHARLHRLGVVRDEDRLRGFNDYNAFPALCTQSAHRANRINVPLSLLPVLAVPSFLPPRLHETHLLPVYTPLICLDHDKPLARNVQTRALDLLHAISARVLVGSDDCLHFLRRDCET
jgi:hypothetical protein